MPASQTERTVESQQDDIQTPPLPFTGCITTHHPAFANFCDFICRMKTKISSTSSSSYFKIKVRYPQSCVQSLQGLPIPEGKLKPSRWWEALSVVLLPLLLSPLSSPPSPPFFSLSSLRLHCYSLDPKSPLCSGPWHLLPLCLYSWPLNNTGVRVPALHGGKSVCNPDAGKDWRQGEKGTTEDEMVGWHHWLDGHEFEQGPGVADGQGSLACCGPWDCRVGHSWATELNWTYIQPSIFMVLLYLQFCIHGFSQPQIL